MGKAGGGKGGREGGREKRKEVNKLGGGMLGGREGGREGGASIQKYRRTSCWPQAAGVCDLVGGGLEWRRPV